jgi:hypothetical protein
MGELGGVYETPILEGPLELEFDLQKQSPLIACGSTFTAILNGKGKFH